MRLAGHLVPSNASDRFQLRILRPFASTFAAYFLPARILRTLVVASGAVAYKSISSRSIIVTIPSFFSYVAVFSFLPWPTLWTPLQLLFNALHHLRALDAAAVGPKN